MSLIYNYKLVVIFFFISVSTGLSQNQYNLDSIRQEAWKIDDIDERSTSIIQTIQNFGLIDSTNSWNLTQWLIELTEETGDEKYRITAYSMQQGILSFGGHLEKTIKKGEETASIYQKLLKNKNLLQKDSFEYMRRMAYCYGANSSSYMRMKNYVEGVNQLQRVEEIFTIIKDTFNIARCYNNFGMFYQEIKQYDKALKYFTEGLVLHKNTKQPEPVAATKANIATLLIEQGKIDKAEKYVLECLELAKNEKLKNSFARGLALSNAANFYKSKKELKLAEKYLIESAEFYKNVKNPPGIASTYLRLFEKNLEEKDLINAKKNLDKATLIAKQIQEVNLTLSCESKLIDYYIATNQTSLAKKLLKENRAKYKNSLDYNGYAITFYQQSQLEAKIGNAEGVYDNIEKYYKIKDSLKNENVLINQELYEIEYETVQKEQEIALLTTKEKAQATQLNYSLGLGALLLLLLGLLFNRFRLKQKTNQLLEEKNGKIELLLKEIHHRVKNNLQTISSLLFLQSAHIKDAEVKEAVAAGQHRVESMALIHQKLYQRDNLAAIEMKDYLTNLGNSLIDTFVENPDRISLKVDMAEHELDVDTAVPLGLIANELITNSIKYAFPENQEGTITLKIAKNTDQKLELLVADDGVGEKNKESGTAFGSQLIHLLTKQLNGTLEQGTDNGYWTKIVL